MNSILIAIIIGSIAGLIDIIPMLIQKLNRKDIISAFIHYLVLGLIIPFVNWEMQAWLKGCIIALATAIPIMIMVYPKDKKAMFPMILFSILLGAGIGWSGAKFIV